MRFWTDEEMFSHVPQADGKVKHTGKRSFAVNMRAFYQLALSECPHLESFHVRGTGTSKFRAEMNQEARLQERLEQIWQDAFVYMDEQIETYVDHSEGFIGEFPPVETPVFKGRNGQSYSFSFFSSAPKKYICPHEQRLHKQYQLLTQDPARIRFLRTVWGIAGCLFLLLFFLAVPAILASIPQATAFLLAHMTFAYVVFAIPVIIVEVFGLLLPVHLSGIKLDPNNLFPKAVAVVGLGSFALANLLYALLPDPTNFLEPVVKWALILYLAAVTIFHIVQCRKALPAYRVFLSNRPQLQTDFVQLYKQNANKIHRYLRLRQLWRACEQPNTAFLPRWYKRIQRRLGKYTKLYKQLK